MARRRLAIYSAIAVVSVAAVICTVFLIRNGNKSSPPAAQQAASPRGTKHAAVTFRQACQATNHPHACEASFTPLPNTTLPDNGPLILLQIATDITESNLKNALTMISQIVDSAADNKNLSKAAKTCTELLGGAAHRVSSSNEALTRGEIKDASAWFSASLAYESGCMSGLNKTGGGLPFVNTTLSFLDNLLNLTSDTLSMMASYDVFGNKIGSWAPPRTERDGFWERVDGSGLGFTGGIPVSLKVNVTVCGGGSCNYETVQEAVNAGPDNDESGRFVIRIKAGMYNETVRVPFQKKNVMFLGDGMGKTIITGSSNVGQPGMTTYDSATVGVLGDGFMAKDLTIQNTAGPDAHQAVAFRSDSDKSIIENCEFIGNQDTLCANTLRQLYKGCQIQGNVDFIFGFSAAVFQDCLILVSPRNLSPDNNVVAAHGRFDPAQTTGFVFLNCTVNGTGEYMALYEKNPEKCINYLGRPWKEYSRTVFIHCNIGSIITPAGWMRWDGDFGLSTLYFAEFDNFGPGSDLSKREKWSNKITADHINVYSVQNFIQGDKWIPMASS